MAKGVGSILPLEKGCLKMSNWEVKKYQNYIDGVWQNALSGESKELRCPGSGEVVSVIPSSGLADVNAAVASAKRAFYEEDWAYNPRQRAAAMFAWAAAMRANLEELATRLSLETGKPIGEARFELNGSIGYLEYYAAATRTLYGGTTAVDKNTLSVLAREPVGVIGVITPWNYPITLLMRDMAPALAAGNTIVLKAAEQTTGCTLAVVEMLQGNALFPRGVMNAVSGLGRIVGNAIVEHKDVDMISFTGGVDTGKDIMVKAAPTMKKLSLELGGKSPNVIFADADLDKALPYAIKAIFTNAGQLCTVGSRLVVEKSIAESFVQRLKTEAEKIKVGYAFDEGTTMGAITTEGQMNKVLGFIEEGKKCAKLITGGHRLTENGLDKGFYVAPTIFFEPPMDSSIVQEEIFGPVLVVQTFETEDEAVAIANGTLFGLASSVWTQDVDRAMRVSRRIRAGSVWINCYNRLFPECETGGFKESGVDRAGGVEGLMKYTEVKHICLDFVPKG